VEQLWRATSDSEVLAVGDRVDAPAWRTAWDALDDGLAKLRACRDMGEIADQIGALALSSCGTDRVALGRIRDEVWSPWLEASATQGAVSLVPDAPTALKDVPVENEVIVAEVRSGGVVVGLLHVAANGVVERAIVQEFADALSSVFALVDVRDRIRTQGQVLSSLAGDVEDLRRDDPIELVPARRLLATGVQPPAAESATGVTRALLTERQREVLDQMLAGRSNAQIAERLVLAVPTVKSHVRAVLRAVGAVNRAEAVARIAQDDAVDD
jgi:DNA-binding NarL/FixJ family response regulator